MAGNFVLRNEGDTVNPFAPRLYGQGLTQGRTVFYQNNGEGSQTTFLVILTQGARFRADLPNGPVVRVYYAGFDLPEFGAGGVRNWKFHSGKISKAPAYKAVTAFDAAANTVTVPAHGYASGDFVALHNRGADATLADPLIANTKYMAYVVDANTLKLLNQASGAPDIANLIDLTSAGANLSRVFIYKADALYFDAEQGRPEFFPGLDFTFPGLSYLEIRLPVHLSDGEDEPQNLKVIMNGKQVYGIVSTGGVGGSNVAAAGAGATVNTSSNYAAGYTGSGAIDGNRYGNTWGAGGGWNSATAPSGGAPEWLEVAFSGSKVIDTINVFTIRDDYSINTTPHTLTETFTAYGITDFKVQYWDGAAWVDIATVAGNNKVWRQFIFTPVSTSKIRVLVTGGAGGYARIIEVEAVSVAGVGSGDVAFDTAVITHEPNPALVAVDAGYNDAKMPLSRFNGPTFVAWRDRADGLINWVGGNDNPAPRASFPTMVGTSYDPATATLTATAAGEFGKTATTEQFTASYPSIEVTYDGHDFGMFFKQTNVVAAFTRQGAQVRAGVLYFDDQGTIHEVIPVVTGDRVKIAYEQGVVRLYKNSVPMPLVSVTQQQLYTTYYCAVEIRSLGGTVSRVLIAPSGTNGAPRSVKRFYGGFVAVEPTPFADLLEAMVHLSGGTSWADFDGQIHVATEPDRTPCFTFVHGVPGTASNVSKVVVKRKNPEEVQNYFRFAFRDLDDIILSRKPATVDRKERRAANGGRLVDPGQLQYGVMTQSQVERIGEVRARLETDLDIGFTVDAFLDSITVVKGSFVNLIDPTAGYTVGSPALCIVNDVRNIIGAEVETVSYELQIITPDFYSDTAHGAVTPGGSSAPITAFSPPPRADDLTAVESIEQMPDNRYVSSISGLVTFGAGFNQHARLFVKSLSTLIASVTFDAGTNRFTSSEIPSGAVALSLGSTTNALPAGASNDAQYYVVDVSGSTFKLSKTVGGVAEVFGAGAANLGVYEYAPWRDTLMDLYPDALNAAGYEIIPAVRGLNLVRAVTRSAADASLTFEQHKTAYVVVVGNIEPPLPPPSVTYDYDGLQVRYLWSASPSYGVRSYIVKDDQNRFLAQTGEGELSYVQTAQEDGVTRRIFSVGSTGVLSTEYAEVTFVRPQGLDWINLTGVVESAGNVFTKTAATGFGNAGAVLSQRILTDAVKATLSAAPDRNTTRQVVGFSYDSTPLNLTDFRYALDFRADGTVWQYQNTTLIPNDTLQIGTYAPGDRFELEVRPPADVQNDYATVVIYRWTTVDGNLSRIAVGGFFEDEVGGVLYAGFALYSNGGVSSLEVRLTGELVPTYGPLPVTSSSANVTYIAGVVTSTGGSGDGSAYAQFSDGLEAGQDGGWLIVPTTAFGYCAFGMALSVAANKFVDIDFRVERYDDNSGAIYEGSTFLANIPALGIGTEIFIGREGGVPVVRLNGKRLYRWAGAPSGLKENAAFLIVSHRNDLIAGSAVRVANAYVLPEAAGIPTSVKPSAEAFFGEQKVSDVPLFGVSAPTVGQALIYDGEKWVNDDAAGGLAIGAAITGGGNNRVLYQSGSAALASSTLFTYDGATLKTQAANVGQTADIFQVKAYDSVNVIRVEKTGAVSLGRASFDGANPTTHNTPSVTVNYYSPIYSNAGLLISNVGTGSAVRLHAGAGALYLTDVAGSPGGLTIGAIYSPYDGSAFSNGYAYWAVNPTNASPSNAFGVNTSPAAGIHVLKTTEQLRLAYDASNYFSATVTSTGAVGFDLVGTSPFFSFGKRVHLQDNLVILGGKNIVLDTTTGTKIGTAATEKLGFYGKTPVVRPATFIPMSAPTISGPDTVDETQLQTIIEDLAQRVNDIVAALNNLGLLG